jgi:hypothetical protein
MKEIALFLVVLLLLTVYEAVHDGFNVHFTIDGVAHNISLKIK